MMKKNFKELARWFLFILNKKGYHYKIYSGGAIQRFERHDDSEFFFGYYDKCPEKNGTIIFQEMGDNKVSIYVRYIQSGKELKIGESNAFNWQLGARAIWIDDDTVSYNDYADGKYVCKWYSISQQKVTKILPIPLMDIHKDYVLTTNFQRLRSVDPDYCYCCIPEMKNECFYDYCNDGIWFFNLKDEEMKLLISINDILSVNKNKLYKEGKHCINHIMIAPDGKSFMFIHRYKVDGKKYDRLMVYNFKELKCLLDDPLQSHFCWLDNHTVMGYCGYNGEIGWFQADTITGKVEKLKELTQTHPKNGHPTKWEDWIAVDSYPNLARMQKLHVYNRKTKEIRLLSEFYHDMKHHDYNRCDLHPRFTSDGKAIYVDTIFSGKRELVKINVNLQ